MSTHKFTVPITNEDVKSLAIGDIVYLNGIIYTARDMAHLKIKELLSQHASLPVDLSGQVIFHAGPVARKENNKWQISVVGPTTSIRMEPYAEMVGKLGVKLIIGKGGMEKDSSEKFQQHGQAYLQAPPGCAVQIANGVKAVCDVFWLENGMPEAMWKLRVENFGPFIVTMDSNGNSRYVDVKKHAYQQLEELYGK